MRVFTKRFQSVNVLTLNTLREYLETISTPERKFKIDKLRGDRVTVSSESLLAGKKLNCSVVLPAYPTGHEHDTPGNPNVVLDPISFVNAENCAEWEIFTPLLGKDVLEFYHKQHPHIGVSVSRCC